MFDPKTHCVVVVGAQWGDEGKGKLVDVLSERADCVVRYQGGANAGHTVVIGEEQFILQQIPSGILHARATCVIGNGVVLDPETLFKELDGLTGRGVDTAGRLFVSERAHLVLPLPQAARRGEREVAEDRHHRARASGPTYEDKYGRRGVRVVDLRDGAALKRPAGRAARPRQPPPRHDGGRAAPRWTSTWRCWSGWRRACCPWPPIPASWCTGRCARASGCSSRGRRARSSTWTTAPTPT